MEFEICIPGQEKSWKLDKFVWVTEFQIFPNLFLADGGKVKQFRKRLCRATKHSASGL